MRTLTSAPMKQHSSRHRAARVTNASAGKFYIILTIGILIAICLHFDILGPSKTPSLLQSRDISDSDRDDETCRLVHKAADQCAFIKKHCAIDEAGFTEYLDLYFCQLSHVKPIAFILLAAWLGLLFSTIGIASSDFFCVDLSTMAKILGMSESMAGVTLLAFGNGSPDVFSTFAAMSTNSGDLAVGELMGAACFITAVVAGSMAIIRPFKVSKKSFVRDVSFFAVAAAFTMYILSDGILHLWECLAMIGYYVSYVSFVLFWHWIEARRRRKYDTEAAARGHYTPVDGLEDHQPYSDEPDVGNSRPSTLRAPSTDDFAALERSITQDDGDYSDEERDRWLSELGSNMRLARPVTRPRSKTIAPVRPSLVGALEFQAVLKTLQRSRNIQSVPLNARRYSDDPNLRAFDVQDNTTSTQRRPSRSISQQSATSNRPNLHVSIPQADEHAGPQTAVEARGRPLDEDLQRRGHGKTSKTTHVSFGTPTIEVSSPPQQPHDAVQPGAHRMQPHSSKSEDLFSHRKLMKRLNSPTLSPRDSPRSQAHILLPSPPRSRSSTRSIPAAASPFPQYHDEPSDHPHSPLESLSLPPPVVSTPQEVLSPAGESDEEDTITPPTQWRWWPYGWLPAPESIACTLFPTVSDWQDKGIWAKFLGLVAAPSVFLLTITLPVVESDNAAQIDEGAPQQTTTPYLAENSKRDDSTSRQSIASSVTQRAGDNGNGAVPTTATVITAAEQHNLRKDHNEPRRDHNASGAGNDVHMSTMQHTALFEDWPRWLLLVQLYTAPITIVLAVFIQSPESLPASWLVRPVLVCLLISTLLLIPVLLTTTPSYRPRQYRWILSLVGFAVSIAWISTIASQVVGTLKALAIILNWSNAIMGLTIFAVGNSVSDLVADVTIANLGYPVMALSACYGGPMLNILIGIGLSGTYTILKGADRRKHKHPEKGFKVKVYHLDVGQTLIVSGVSLLVTLVGILILVPYSKWMMTRKIGVALIIVWILSTIGNVVLEVTGAAAVSKTQ